LNPRFLSYTASYDVEVSKICQAVLGGAVFCPVPGCAAVAPFSHRDIASQVDDACFAQYVDATALLPIAIETSRIQGEGKATRAARR